jgi:uncharacterized protein YfbU (UPF0304 family)
MVILKSRKAKMESISSDLLEKHRTINVDHNDWYEFVYESFKERMEKQGITADEMSFSGFWSQGDGASFTGCINPLRFLRKHFPKDYPMLRKVVGLGGRVHLAWKHSGRYYHEYSNTFDLDVDRVGNCIETPTDFHEQVVASYDNMLQEELSTFEDDAIPIIRGYMRELYRELEKEYDYLTSDEVVSETIIANELHKECA